MLVRKRMRKKTQMSQQFCKYRETLIHRVVENKVLTFRTLVLRLMSEVSVLSSRPHGVPIYFYIYNCFLRNTDAAHTSFH